MRAILMSPIFGVTVVLEQRIAAWLMRQEAGSQLQLRQRVPSAFPFIDHHSGVDQSPSWAPEKTAKAIRAIFFNDLA